MSEASLQDGVPITRGWFVVNVRQAPWLHNRMRSVCRFGGEGEAHFDDVGVSMYHLQPGQSMSLYHHVNGREDLVEGIDGWFKGEPVRRLAPPRRSLMNSVAGCSFAAPGIST